MGDDDRRRWLRPVEFSWLLAIHLVTIATEAANEAHRSDDQIDVDYEIVTAHLAAVMLAHLATKHIEPTTLSLALSNDTEIAVDYHTHRFHEAIYQRIARFEDEHVREVLHHLFDHLVDSLPVGDETDG